MDNHDYLPRTKTCSCGWSPPLGVSTLRAFDKHILEMREKEGQ